MSWTEEFRKQEKLELTFYHKDWRDLWHQSFWRGDGAWSMYFGRKIEFSKTCIWPPEKNFSFSFLVDACTSLEEHIHTEGLFRKSGSVIRLRALKVCILLNYNFSFVLLFYLVFRIEIFKLLHELLTEIELQIAFFMAKEPFFPERNYTGVPRWLFFFFF